jgi:hypothetical protein
LCQDAAFVKQTAANFFENASRLYEQKQRAFFSRISALDVGQVIIPVAKGDIQAILKIDNAYCQIGSYPGNIIVACWAS